MDVRIAETRRQRLDATGRLFAAGGAIGSDVSYLQGTPSCGTRPSFRRPRA
jgi:hypothetical protein